MNHFAQLFAKTHKTKSFAKARLSAETWKQAQETGWLAQPMISVVLPVYNHAHFLREAVDSILHSAKRYPLELILVNDGSSDDTPKICSSFAKTPGVIVIHQENKGLSMALNNGFALASGDFLSWSSADNTFEPGALDYLADHLLEHPEHGFVYADVRLINEDGKPFLNSDYRKPDQCPDDSSRLRLPSLTESISEINDNFINACFLYRREAGVLTGQYLSELLGFEDYDYWLRLSLSSRLAKLQTESPLYNYRLHSQSLTAALNTEDLAQKQLEIVRKNKQLKIRLSSNLTFFVSKEHSALSKMLLSCGDRLLGKDPLRQANQELIWLSNDPISASDSPGNNDWVVISHYSSASTSTLTCLNSYLLNPELGIFSAVLQEKAAADSCSQARGFLSFGPLNIPKSFCRARESNWGAITPHHEAKGAVLAFADEISQGETATTPPLLVELVSNSLSDWTLALYCESRSGRGNADALNLAAGCPNNLRIIDQTTNKYIDLSTAQFAHTFHPIVYVLSSCQCLLALLGKAPDFGRLLEVYIQAGLAAAAGKPLVVITEDLPPPCYAGLSHVLEQNKLVYNSLLRRLSLAPHVWLIKQANLMGLSVFLEEICHSPLEHNSLDAWLEEQSSLRLRSRLFSLFN